MFEKGDSSNRKEINGCPFQKLSRQNLSWFFSYHRRTIFLKGFIVNPTERVQVLLKNGTGNFQFSPTFERSVRFYVTVTGEFERFQYFNFETSFLKNGRLFLKNQSTPFQLKVLRLKRQNYYTKLPYQKPVLREIEWDVQNGPIIKSRVLLVTVLFF